MQLYLVPTTYLLFLQLLKHKNKRGMSNKFLYYINSYQEATRNAERRGQ